MRVSRYSFFYRVYLLQFADPSAKRDEALLVQRRAAQQQHSVLVQECTKPFGIPAAWIESIVGDQLPTKPDRSEFLNFHSPFSGLAGVNATNQASYDPACFQESLIPSI